MTFLIVFSMLFMVALVVMVAICIGVLSREQRPTTRERDSATHQVMISVVSLAVIGIVLGAALGHEHAISEKTITHLRGKHCIADYKECLTKLPGEKTVQEGMDLCKEATRQCLVDWTSQTRETIRLRHEEWPWEL